MRSPSREGETERSQFSDKQDINQGIAFFTKQQQISKNYGMLDASKLLIAEHISHSAKQEKKMIRRENLTKFKEQSRRIEEIKMRKVK